MRQADGGTLRASVNAQRQVRPLRRGLQELARRALVTAVELVMAIDDHLRRVDLSAPKTFEYDSCRTLNALAENGSRQP